MEEHFGALIFFDSFCHGMGGGDLNNIDFIESITPQRDLTKIFC
jgi:hypothetical protein